ADGATAQDAFDAAGDAFTEAVGAGEDTGEMMSEDMETTTDGDMAEGVDPAMGGAEGDETLEGGEGDDTLDGGAEGGAGGMDALAGALGEASGPTPDGGAEGGGGGMDALAGALGEASDPAVASDEMADVDALLGATMDAGTAQGGATADTGAGAGETPAATVGSDPEDEAEDETAPEDVDIA
ncbi:MAG: hypothetical protein VCB63_16735, partial [Alphaproteobacteria bacterium]